MCVESDCLPSAVVICGESEKDREKGRKARWSGQWATEGAFSWTPQQHQLVSLTSSLGQKSQAAKFNFMLLLFSSHIRIVYLSHAIHSGYCASWSSPSILSRFFACNIYHTGLIHTNVLRLTLNAISRHVHVKLKNLLALAANNEKEEASEREILSLQQTPTGEIMRAAIFDICTRLERERRIVFCL
jgi:hypothetical protein